MDRLAEPGQNNNVSCKWHICPYGHIACFAVKVCSDVVWGCVGGLQGRASACHCWRGEEGEGEVWLGVVFTQGERGREGVEGKRRREGGLVVGFGQG